MEGNEVLRADFFGAVFFGTLFQGWNYDANSQMVW